METKVFSNFDELDGFIAGLVLGNPLQIFKGDDFKPITGGVLVYTKGRNGGKLVRGTGDTNSIVAIKAGDTTGQFCDNGGEPLYKMATINKGNAYETAKAIAAAYGFDVELKQTEEQKRKRATADEAREILTIAAPILADELENNPNGEVATYIKEKRGLPLQPGGFPIFGAITPASIKAVNDELLKRGKVGFADILDGLGISDYWQKRGYRLAVFYFNTHNAPIYLFTRNILPNANKDETKHNPGTDKTGLYRAISYYNADISDKTAYIIEGAIKAALLVQWGYKNVIALGNGGLPTEVINYLKLWKFTKVIYLPDVDIIEAGRRYDLITGVIEKATAAGLPLRVFDLMELPGASSVLEQNKAKAERNRKENEPLKYKTDLDDFWLQTNGGDDLPIDGLPTNKIDIEGGAKYGFDMQLKALDAAATEANAYETIKAVEKIARYWCMFADGVAKTLDCCANLNAIGITGKMATNAANFAKLEAKAKAETERKKQIADVSEKLKQAAADGDTRQILELSRRLDWLQRGGEASEFKKQLNKSIDEIEDEIRNSPDTIRTKWRLGKEKRGGGFIHNIQTIEFFPADLAVFCAPTSHGKTMFLFTALYDLAKADERTGNTNKHYLYISCEESQRQLLKRFYSIYTDGIDTTKTGKNTNGKPCFKTGKRKAAIEAAIKNYSDVLDENGGIYGKAFETLKANILRHTNEAKNGLLKRIKFVNPETATAEDICAEICDFVDDVRSNGGEVGAIFVDYFQLLHSGADTQAQARNYELKDICEALKNTAIETETAIVTAAQLNRNVLGNKDGLTNATTSNIGEGADIERIAHDIYFIWQIEKTPDFQIETDDDGNPTPKNLKSQRLRRILTDVNKGSGTPIIDVPENAVYIEALKARDGVTALYGVAMADFERGYIKEVSDDLSEPITKNDFPQRNQGGSNK